ncbi:MAG: peptidoglycan bridge formation glycyltransferase FemA/FemB family protein [Sulfurospirillaceae bacterium]|nr:peptidoglycan bridge formation glycyltransferase FemA/FemB family protein [Sulfurospirillaceae bacterium]
MPNYQLITDANVWNQAIAQESNFSAYQLYELGQYKNEMGWKTLSIKANKDGKIGYFQIAYKQKFNIFIGWCVGSIAGAIECFQKEALIRFIQDTFGVKCVFIKTSFTNVLDFDDSLALHSAGWKKSCKKINSDYTIYVDLHQSMEELTQSCSSNFRKNLKRGYEKNKEVEVCFLQDVPVPELDKIFRKFETKKEVVLPKEQELSHIKNHLGKQIVVATSKIDGHIVAIRAFLYFENQAIDFWAASVDEGRQSYSSHILLFELLKKAKALGCTKYDMSGIDPVSNPGVFAFKNGLRASIVEKLGEWEISNSKLISFLINRLYL